MAEKSFRNLRLVINAVHLHRLTRLLLLFLPLAAITLFLIHAVHHPSPPPAQPNPLLDDFSLPARATYQINVADTPEHVRSGFFGLLATQFRLSNEELSNEESWRSRILALQGDAHDCNLFQVNPSAQVVQRLNDSVVTVPGAERRRSEAEQHVLRWLRRDGFHVQPGGAFVPSDCRPRETIAIIIPYRDRFNNLLTFLNYMHRFLQQQKRRYLVVLAEQANYNVSFNRAKLFNAVVRELLEVKSPSIDCFILHDVDKVPYHLFNLYTCGFQPRQLATMSWVSGKGWVSYYASFFGGVTAFNRWHLLKMNGVSNVFYGWGAEDDDMYARAILAGYLPSYPSKFVGRMWVMGHHDDMKVIPKRYQMLFLDKIANRMLKDGLWEARYGLVERQVRPLYTKFSFNV